jgi:hypothetical protein
VAPQVDDREVAVAAACHFRVVARDEQVVEHDVVGIVAADTHDVSSHVVNGRDQAERRRRITRARRRAAARDRRRFELHPRALVGVPEPRNGRARQREVGHRVAVDEGAIAAPGVLQVPAVAVVLHACVLTGDQGMVDDDVVRRVTTNRRDVRRCKTPRTVGRRDRQRRWAAVPRHAGRA